MNDWKQVLEQYWSGELFYLMHQTEDYFVCELPDVAVYGFGLSQEEAIDNAYDNLIEWLGMQSGFNMDINFN